MRRYRWLSAQWPSALKDVASKLLKVQYTDRKGEGFILSRNDRDIVGKYVKKSLVTDQIVDPFGNVSEFSLVEYNIVNFNLYDEDQINLELVDPPRALSSFFRAISDAVGSGFYVSELEVSPLVWVERFEERGRQIRINRIDAAGINIENKAAGKVTVQGTDDIREEFMKFVGRRRHDIANIKGMLIVSDDVVNFALNKNGSVSITETHADVLKLRFKNALAKCVGKG